MGNEIKNGDLPAFATGDTGYIQEGLTKREWMATMILAGSNSAGIHWAVNRADELLKALEK